MAVTKLSNSGIATGGVLKYDSMLAGNAAFSPTPFQSIATINGTGSSGVISFTSIPSTFTHLQIRAIAKSDGGTPAPNLTFNSDTGANYTRHRTIGNGSSASAIGEENRNFITALGNASLPSGANIFGVFVYDILDYANTNKYKTVRVMCGQNSNGSGGIDFTSGVWMNTAAISTITFTLTSNNYTSSTQFALYGIKNS